MKVCSKCKETKGLEEFSIYQRAKDGRSYTCKQCKNEWYQKTREYHLKYRKKHYLENRESILESQRKYYQNNKEKVAEYMRKYQERNRERIAEKKKEYQQRNKELSELYQSQNIQGITFSEFIKRERMK